MSIGDDGRGAGPRAPRSRPPLPSGRAVVGSLLIAIAAGSAFVAHRGAERTPSSRYLVLTERVEAGERLEPAALGTVAIDLPDDLGAVPAAELDAVLGRVARTRLEELDLLRPGDLLEPGRFVDPDVVELALELPPARALGGSLRPGERVDLYATDPGGAGTSVLARDVAVVSLGDPDAEGLGVRGDLRVRLAVPSGLAADVVDASVRAELTLALPALRPGGREP